MLRSSIAFFLIGLLFCACSSSKKGIFKTRRPTWKENFNQKTHFDTTKWSKIPRGRSDWNRLMSDDEECFAMRNGKLILRGMVNKHLKNDTSGIITGGVYTKRKVNFGFGRLEIRAKLNGATGAWPAFWMLAENTRWPNGGEIDIMEHLSYDSIVYQTVHSNYTLKLKIKDNPLSHATARINRGDFNVYALAKYPDSLVFFVNNKRTFAYPRIKTEKEGQFPFSEHKHYLLLDMQLGGSWVGKVDTADLPVEMEIDWVRFYGFEN